MIPDALRPLALLACLSLLGWMAWDTTVFAETREVGIRAALRDPPSHDGAEVLLMMWTVAELRGPGAWLAERQGQQVEVLGSSRGLSAGDTVTAVGTFRAPGPGRLAPQLQLRWQELHRWRRAKEALGVLGVALALLAWPLGFRLADGRLEERG